MVTTTTNENDDLPTHDCFGTDLARVRTMLGLGYSESLIAQSMGLYINRVRHAVIVATGDRQGAPTLEEIAARCAEIQAGWTPEQAESAKWGEARLSSSLVRDMSRFFNGKKARQAHHEEAIRRRVESGDVRVVEMTGGGKPYEARVQVGGRTCAKRFNDRDEAVEWGRAWMRRQWDLRQAEACAGK
jgi:hypothetical protein